VADLLGYDLAALLGGGQAGDTTDASPRKAGG